MKEPTITEGKDQVEIDAWEMVNSTTCSWLLNVIDPKIQPSIAYANTAKQMWEDLKKRYAVSDISKIHDLKSQIANCKQGEMKIVEYYAKLVGLWNELDGKTTQHLSTCGKCECKLGEKILQDLEQEKSHQFLMGLNDEKFGFLRGQILATDPLPPLDKIFNIVRQEEHHKGVIQRREEKVDSALAFAVPMKTNQSNLERPTCKHCGRTGHDEASCYELIGYPPPWSACGRGRGGRGNRGSRGGRTGVGRGRGARRESAYAVGTVQDTQPSTSTREIQ